MLKSNGSSKESFRNALNKMNDIEGVSAHGIAKDINRRFFNKNGINFPVQLGFSWFAEALRDINGGKADFAGQSLIEKGQTLGNKINALNTDEEKKKAIAKIANDVRDSLFYVPVSSSKFDIPKELIIARYYEIEENVDYFTKANKNSDPDITINMTDKWEEDFNKYLRNVMRNRPTRGTQKNPDSSRSHLFIKMEIKLDSSTNPFTIYVSDLGGNENPYEYFGEASLEGFYIVSSLKQLEIIINNYNNYKGTTLNDIVSNDDVKRYMKLDPDISKTTNFWGYANSLSTGSTYKNRMVNRNSL